MSLTERRRIARDDAGIIVERPDTLAVEEPLEIRVNGTPVAVTMRTPGHDLDLALGFLTTEGITSPAARMSATACADNVVDVRTESPVQSVSRNFYMTSACGTCGKASIEAVRTTSPYDVSVDNVTVQRSVLVSLPEKLRETQRVFDRTGGLHAAGIFSADGELMCVREDVGRHNAVDKVIGWAVSQDLLPLTGAVPVSVGSADALVGAPEA